MFGYPDWLDINTIQSGHSKDSVDFMVTSIRNSQKIIIDMEPWYEGILGEFGAYYQRMAFWLCVLSGAKGHSYGAHGIWQMADGDNFMGHWGESDWRKSINFEGATQLGKSVLFLKKYKWWEMVSAPEVITPAWSNNNANYPVAAKIDKNTFVYFPDVEAGEFSLKNSGKKTSLEWFDPGTLKSLKKEMNEDGLIIFPDVKTKDLLCVVTAD
jgi:hypothetical protein